MGIGSKRDATLLTQSNLELPPTALENWTHFIHQRRRTGNQAPTESQSIYLREWSEEYLGLPFLLLWFGWLGFLAFGFGGFHAALRLHSLAVTDHVVCNPWLYRLTVLGIFIRFMKTGCFCKLFFVPNIYFHVERAYTNGSRNQVRCGFRQCSRLSIAHAEPISEFESLWGKRFCTA